MSDFAADKRQPVDAWLCESLRLTVFPVPSDEKPPESAWWHRLVGTQPESRTELIQAGEIQEVGAFKDHRLTVTVAPVRISVTLQAAPESTSTPWGSLKFGDGVDLLKSLAKRWFEISPPLWRVAFGSVLVFPIEKGERQLGYEMLQPYLPVVELDPQNSSDFAYQINRPRPSSVLGKAEINRLSKWTVAQWQNVQVTASSPPHFATTGWALRIELDINTAPAHRDEISKTQLPELFDELVNLGTEIVRDGDRR